MRRLAPALLLLAPALAFAQANVVEPRTAGQNHVRWDHFDWKFVDLLQDEGKGAGLRLYYYDGERKVAERAAAAIVEEYEHLVEVFGFEPKERIPYILYDSHQELEQTNLFQIGEGTLGVTSPLDLRMTAAYWGDHQRFRHVSLHEMVHQFTIQKVNAKAGESRVAGSPLEAMPLWFIEGIAEYYSTPGHFSADDERWVRDLVANPEPTRGWFLPGFYDDEIRSFPFTYKLGQARVFFLAETYGKETPQKILDLSWRMRPGRGGFLGGGGGKRKPIEFQDLVKEVTGDGSSKLEAKWEDWLKKRYYTQYLAARQQPSDLREEQAVHGNPDSFVISPDGRALVYRTIEPVTGVTTLVMVDPRDPSSGTRIASDGRPGVDSLHYFDRAVAAIDEERIAWVARRGPNDVVHVGKWKHTQRDSERNRKLDVSARLSTGSFRTFDPRGSGVRELGNPAFSPDGKTIAFIGLDEDGIVDVWTLDLDSAKWTRVTNDVHAERELDWGEPGIAVSSDATPDGLYALFLVDPATGQARRLRATAGSQRHPRFRPGTSRVLFAGDASGKWDVYEMDVAPEAPAAPPTEVTEATDDELQPTKGTDGDAPLVQQTDFSAGLTHPVVAGDRLWALAFLGGRFRVYSLPVGSALAAIPPPSSMGPAKTGEPWTIPSRELTGSTDYKPWNTGNWSTEQAFVALGAGNGLFGGGFLYFQDLFRDRTVLVQGQAFGDASLTDLQVVYFDRTRRVPLGVALFMSPTFVLDPEFTTGMRPIYFLERKFGVIGLAEYPFNRYVRVGTGLGVATTNRTVPEWLDNFADDEQRTDWQARNAGWAAEIDASAHAGYDSLLWTWETGPMSGSSLLATGNVYFQPTRESWFGDASIDAMKYFRVGRTVALGTRLTTGRSFGDEWRRPFYVYSTDNLRGVPWYRYDYLISDAYLVGQAELAVPLNRIIQVALFNNVIGIAGIDAGSTFDRYGDVEERATAAAVVGANMRLAIFDLRLHFARPFDIGGLKPGETEGSDGRPIVPDGWVTNFSMRYAWF